MTGVSSVLTNILSYQLVSGAPTPAPRRVYLAGFPHVPGVQGGLPANQGLVGGFPGWHP